MAYGKALDLRQIGTPPTPPAGVSLLYPKSDGKWYTKDPAGTESPLGGASPTTTIIADWNAATANGFYTSLNTATNAPAAVYLLGEVVAVDANNVTQTVWNWVGGTGSDTIAWRRQCVSGTWQAWYRIRMSQTELDALYAAKVHTHPVTDFTATGTRSSATYLRGDNTWATPTDTTYAVPTQAEAEAGTATTGRAFSAQRVAQAIAALAPAARSAKATASWDTQYAPGWFYSSGAAGAPSSDIYIGEVRQYVGALADLQITQVIWNPYPNVYAHAKYQRKGSLPYGGSVTWTAWESVYETEYELDARYGRTDDTWHDVTFKNGWSSETTADPVQYTKRGGAVYFRGRLHGGTISTVAFTLPVGYRPDASDTSFFITIRSAVSEVFRIAVATNGDFTVDRGDSTKLSFLSTSPVVYPAV